MGKESRIYWPWATGFCPALPYQKASKVSWEIAVRVVFVFCGGRGAPVRMQKELGEVEKYLLGTRMQEKLQLWTLQYNDVSREKSNDNRSNN